MAEENFIEMPQPLGLFAGELYSRGKEFLVAFEKLSEQDNGDLNYVRYFLLTHSIELLLKSYLAANGETKRSIPQLGHELSKILRQCEMKSIPYVPNLRSFVDCLFEMNKDHDFRYPTGFILTVPEATECLSIARSLVQALAPTVQKAAIEATLQFASDTRELRGQKVRWSD